MGSLRQATLLANLLLAAAAGAHAFVVVFEAGAGESVVSQRQFNGGFPSDSSFSSALEPLFHPLSWLEQQLEGMEALQQAAFEDAVLRRLGTAQQRAADLEEDSEDEMLHQVGCQRFTPAMHQYQEQASHFGGDGSSWIADLHQDTAITLPDFDDQEGTYSADTAITQPDTDLQEQAEAEAAAAAQGQTLSAADRGDNSRGEAEPFSQGAAASREAAATLSAWSDDINTDAGTDIADLLTLSSRQGVRQQGVAASQDNADDASLWWSEEHDMLHRHSLYSRLLGQLLLIRSLVWRADTEMIAKGKGASGGAGHVQLPIWYEEPLPADPEHFTEDDLAKSLTSEPRVDWEGRHGPSGAAAAGAAAVGAAHSSYWLDWDNDGILDVKLAMYDDGSDDAQGSGNKPADDRHGGTGGVEVTQGAWRRFLLAALLTATVAMTAFFIRALLQLRGVMATGVASASASASPFTAAGGDWAGHVMVPVTLERDGRHVHGLMLLPEDECDVMAKVEEGKGTLMGGWMGSKCDGKGRTAVASYVASNEPAADPSSEPLLWQQDEEAVAAGNVVVAAQFARLQPPKQP